MLTLSIIHLNCILPIHFHFKSFLETSWSDYFGSAEYTKETDLTEHYTVLDNIWVYGCTFSSINYDGYGAAIHKNSNTALNLLVESSVFHECCTSSSGGAIYFNTGQCVIAFSCGFKCKITNYASGQFCYVQVSTGTNKNYVIDSSITKTTTDTFATLLLAFGDVSCKGLNVSNNEVKQFSGIRILDPSTCYISFSSFRNNNSTGESDCFTCLDFRSGSPQMNNTNIIENAQQIDWWGIIRAEDSATLTMNNCSLYGNCNNGKGDVFCTKDSGSSIICSYCSFGPNQQTTYDKGPIDFGTTSESFINYYEFLDLNECKAGLDEWSNIKPVIPTPKPSQTPEETWYPYEDLVQTAKINFYQLLKYIFLLCCLNPDPAKDIWHSINI